MVSPAAIVLVGPELPELGGQPEERARHPHARDDQPRPGVDQHRKKAADDHGQREHAGSTTLRHLRHKQEQRRRKEQEDHDNLRRDARSQQAEGVDRLDELADQLEEEEQKHCERNRVAVVATYGECHGEASLLGWRVDAMVGVR